MEELDFDNPLYASATAGGKSPDASGTPYSVPSHTGNGRTNTGTSSVAERDYDNPLYSPALGGAVQLDGEYAIPGATYATLEPGSDSYDYMEGQAQPHYVNNLMMSQGVYETPQ